MGITKLKRIKENKRGSPSNGLRNNLFYICDPGKTQGGLYVGGNAGTDPETIYRTMIRNKEYWGKTDGSQAFHYMIAFHPTDPVDELLACRIAEEFVQSLLMDDYYYAYAVHHDKAHMHVHITFDSVSKTDGKKFHSPRGDWEQRIQPITDRLCRKYLLKELCYGKESCGTDYGEWKHAKETKENGQRYSWFDVIRDDIDEAIERTQSYEEFLASLVEEGYVARGSEVLSLKPYGKSRAVRTRRLGPGYSKEEIMERIRDKPVVREVKERYRIYGDQEKMRKIIYDKVQRSPGWKMKPFQRQFYHRWYRTCFIRKPGYRQNWKYKKDILELQKLSECIQYMLEHDIEDRAGMEKRKRELIKEQEAIGRRVTAMRTKLYRGDVMKLVNRCERLKKRIDNVDPEKIQEEIVSLQGRIEKILPYEEALSLRDQLRDQIYKEKRTGFIIRKEMRILENMESFSKDPLHPVLDGNRQVAMKERKKEERKDVRGTGGERKDTNQRGRTGKEDSGADERVPIPGGEKGRAR